MESSAPAAREVSAARRAFTSASAWAGDAAVPEPAVSRRAVTSGVFRNERNSSLVSENMVENVSLSMSSKRARASGDPCSPSALRARETSRSTPVFSSTKTMLPVRSAPAGR